jgi:hypothetical protein
VGLAATRSGFRGYTPAGLAREVRPIQVRVAGSHTSLPEGCVCGGGGGRGKEKDAGRDRCRGAGHVYSRVPASTGSYQRHPRHMVQGSPSVPHILGWFPLTRGPDHACAAPKSRGVLHAPSHVGAAIGQQHIAAIPPAEVRGEGKGRDTLGT